MVNYIDLNYLYSTSLSSGSTAVYTNEEKYRMKGTITRMSISAQPNSTFLFNWGDSSFPNPCIIPSSGILNYTDCSIVNKYTSEQLSTSFICEECNNTSVIGKPVYQYNSPKVILRLEGEKEQIV